MNNKKTNTRTESEAPAVPSTTVVSDSVQDNKGESMNENTIEKALVALDSVCDGAVELDGTGFNGTDARFGRSLASQINAGRKLTLNQARFGYKIIRKYKKQLLGLGVDYEKITAPESDKSYTRKKVSNKMSLEGDSVKIVSGYNSDLVARIKGDLQGRRFNSDDKSWSAKVSDNNLAALARIAADFDFEVINGLLDLFVGEVKKSDDRENLSRASDSDIEVEGLGGELRPFQKAGVKYAAQTRKLWIADEMGLGKTVEALATLQHLNAFPALIVCPASLKYNWAREAAKWLPGKTIEILNGKKPEGYSYSADVMIVNYDLVRGTKKKVGKTDRGFPKYEVTLTGHAEKLMNIPLKAIVFDEAHYLKNPKAQRTIAAQELAWKVDVRLLLTGTPILNAPIELVSQLRILGRLKEFGGFKGFTDRYAPPQNNGYGNKYGAANLEELNDRLRRTCFIRRKKDQVLKELPAKQRAQVEFDITNRKEYEAALANVIKFLRETEGDDKAESAKKAQQLVQIETLKQLAAEGKLDAIKTWVEDFLESGEKLVLFAWHKKVVDALMETFPGAVRITGADNAAKRDAAVTAFQNDPKVKLLVANIQAGGVGLTLTAASNVAFVEYGWNPAAQDQAEDRCHRIGQTDSVNVWNLVGRDTIDEDILNLIDKKRKVVDAGTDGKSDGGEVFSVLDELIKKLRKTQ